ncbi:MAG TPA: hypothetical protein VMA09_13560 [Candidatus Binataceae bacterium]|nr:hypothetical protein [Candidatus Binataceae bacterium]
MQFLTTKQAQDWCIACNIELDAFMVPKREAAKGHSVRVTLPHDYTRLLWVARLIEGSLKPRDRCLFWVTKTEVWPSSENWHLYYRIRQSYGDYRSMEDAPGHMFLNYEDFDLITFVEIGIVAGWDIHLLPLNGYGRIFVCHDGWVQFTLESPQALAEITSEFLKIGSSIVT